MKKESVYLLIFVSLIVGIGTNSYGLPAYLTQYNSRYGTKTSCSLCHTSPPSLNATGNTFLNGGHNVAAIAPAGSATAPPAVTQPSPSPTQPNAATAVTPQKSKAPKVKLNKSPASTVAQASPGVPQPSPQASSVTTSRQKNVSAAKQKGTPSRAGKKNTATSKGAQGISASTKNAASTIAAQATIQGGPRRNGNALGSNNNPAFSPTAGQPGRVVQDNLQNMDIWAGTWFKVTMENRGFYTGKSGLSNDRGSVDLYLKIESWDPAKKALQGSLYQQDAQTGQWDSGPLLLNDISGSDTHFRFSSQAAGDLSYGFTGRIRGTQINRVPQNANLKTIGGYHVQRNVEPDSEKPMAGWLSVTGELIPEGDVPVPTDARFN